MEFSGFADEASKEFDLQIKATKELGWKYIESRAIGDKNLSTLNDKEFEDVVHQLNDSGIKINCYASSIANWGKSPRSDEDFESSIIELKNVVPRMKTLGINLLRGMSFSIDKDYDLHKDDIEKNVFTKVEKLVEICEDNGIFYLHENCMNYGGMSYEHTLKLLDKIKSPYFKLIYDTGNPVNSLDRRGGKPYKIQNSFEFYNNIKEFIKHIHIKDGILINNTSQQQPEVKWTFPGEGDGCIKEILKDLVLHSYQGYISIEPHMVSVFHDKNVINDNSTMYDNYIEYGKKLMNLLSNIKKPV